MHAHWVAVQCEASEAMPTVAEASEASRITTYKVSMSTEALNEQVRKALVLLPAVWSYLLNWHSQPKHRVSMTIIEVYMYLAYPTVYDRKRVTQTSRHSQSTSLTSLNPLYTGFTSLDLFLNLWITKTYPRSSSLSGFHAPNCTQR